MCAAGARARPLRHVANAAAFAIAVLCLLGAASREAAAQYSQQGSKLVASDAVGSAQQGYSVAVSADGNTMIVGGIGDNSGDGAAGVYTRSGGVWTEQQKLIPSDAANPAEFGYSVALSADGNTALVGGQGDNNLFGAAWVFTRSGGVWTQQGAKLTVTDQSGSAQFGFSVALSADGNTAIVGGPADSSNIGAAWVFTRGGGVWSEQQKLVGTGYVNFMNTGIVQGWSVALSGDGNTAAVGGPSDNRTGATWVFTRSGGVWSQQGAKLAAAGYSVALSGGVGNILLVGVNAGATASVFVRNGGVWAQFAEFTGTPTTGGPIGPSVALSTDGNTALLGGRGDNTNVGAAWVFTFNDGVWTQNGSKLVASDESGAGSFGYGVALSADGSTAIIGGPGDNSGAGAAWAFVAAPPTVTALSPAIGAAAGGTSVTITGTNFLGAAAVQFGLANAASFTIASATSITAVSPPGGGTVDVTVTNPGGASATSTADQFTYIGASTPTVTAIAPTSGPPAGGTSVIISGSGFNGVSAVQFGATSAASFTLNNNNQITATAPAGSGTVDVTVTVGYLTSTTSAADRFTYGVAPAVTSVAPDTGSTAGGTNVTVTGTNFVAGATVNFGGAAATNVNVVSATSITATSPARSAGIVDVTVTTSGGTSATGAADGFTYVTTFSLSAGVSGSGTVTSTPSGISCGSTCSASFANGTQVTLNETPASGWVFSGWSGACSGAGSCVVTMSAAENVTAAFLIAQGGLTRTFVSSSGSDTNPCTVTAPCATFAQAFTLTQPTGIIAALDPGKYGPLTITYPVTVNGNGWAAITATANGNGITINADVGNVILTGLKVDGAGAAYNGIVFNSGASLTVSNCIVKDFISNNSVTGNGIMIAPTTGTVDFTIVNTVALNNGSAGIHYLPASGSATATGAIDHVTAANNAIGMAVDLSAASAGSAAVTISNSVANNNSGGGIVTASAAGTVTVTADRDEISSNGTGVGVGANTSVLLSRSVIAKNSTYGISNSGTAASSQDNRIAGNGNGNVINGTVLTSVAQQ